MNYSDLLNAMHHASLFDLYRLRVGIDRMLDDPERCRAVKNRLRPGMTVSYFHSRENRSVNAMVEEVHRTCLYVRNVDDGKRWSIRFYQVNLAGAQTDLHPATGQVQRDRSQWKVGESVGFHDQKQGECYGHILKLNPKTAAIVTTTGGHWRVPYDLLFQVMDSQSPQQPLSGLLEGELLKDGIS